MFDDTIGCGSLHAENISSADISEFPGKNQFQLIIKEKRGFAALSLENNAATYRVNPANRVSSFKVVHEKAVN